ncbi:GNAT family N-acetyltransferase [Bosea vestrisii]|uniref:GNAT family N-acetyltransferase n=1 Tax=Bosea vestrisii TaxID=151416 RepID=UPI0024E03D1E|nr:GNAT family N-acetyltransferase [Bosea vestrisii]WID96857.1 GNAT family N-acetyltransferase [Bosea vestrisii]
MSDRIVSKIVSLHTPGRDVLPAYVRALEAGWSPNTMRDVAPEQLAAIAADPDVFVEGLNQRGGTIRLHDDSEVARLPDMIRWIIAIDQPERPFVGSINLRWQEDEAGRPVTELPSHVLGHVGYTILPDHAGHGYASAALAAVLAEARAIGLPFLKITCDTRNLASRRIIEKNGGRFLESFLAPFYGPEERLMYRIDLQS